MLDKLYSLGRWIRTRVLDNLSKAMQRLYAERITVLLAVIAAILINQPPRVEISECQKSKSVSFIVFYFHSIDPDFDCLEQQAQRNLISFQKKSDSDIKLATIDANQKVDSAQLEADASVEKARIEAAAKVLEVTAPVMVKIHGDKFAERLMQQLSPKSQALETTEK